MSMHIMPIALLKIQRNKSKQIEPYFLFTAHKHTLILLLKIAVHLSVQFSTCTQGAHKQLRANIRTSEFL